ncbi:putative nucleotidyltransferase component of viral defense system [Rhizobium fabae]|uniref:Putative nucleotidyltransferase component of viral defense system n=1 Tax=Rhizobium fabae TaxID=573179 RepID=A0A7W6BC44_9HYPH|nr:putative nucleotidyltransferase component of viral defense system [Rhizobium fabae]
MARDQYVSQLELLVQTLPMIADEPAFALKGGTAINLFYRDLPRLSVDIDLTYLPLKPRDESLAEIDEALDRVEGMAQHRNRSPHAVELYSLSGPSLSLTKNSTGAILQH